jgi:hypothetical protein
VVIPKHEFAGVNRQVYREERIDFPASRNIHVMDMAGYRIRR